jgi:hypothetical protein
MLLKKGPPPPTEE